MHITHFTPLYNHSSLLYDCTWLVAFSLSVSLPWMFWMNRTISNMQPDATLSSIVTTCLALGVFSPLSGCRGTLLRIRLRRTIVTTLIGTWVISPNAAPLAFLLQRRRRIVWHRPYSCIPLLLIWLDTFLGIFMFKLNGSQGGSIRMKHSVK